MSRNGGSIGRKGSGTAFIVAFLAALFFGLGISASPASALCTFDKNKFESRVEYWRSASAAAEALRDQPLSWDDYEVEWDANYNQWGRDSDAFEDWKFDRTETFDLRRDRLIDAALDEFWATERMTLLRAQRWFERNISRLGKARALKIANARWYRARARLVKRRDAKIGKARKACNLGIRGVVARADKVTRYTEVQLELIIDILDLRYELWDEQNELSALRGP